MFGKGVTILTRVIMTKRSNNYDEAIRLNPQFAFANYMRALAYRSLGEQELADRDFQKAKELGYDP